MAAVLFDGMPSSVKALEFALIPSTFIQFETQQLLLLSGWKESKDLGALTVPSVATDFISKSRLAQHTLNYKLEMVKLSSLNGDGFAGPNGSTGVTPQPPSSAPTPEPTAPTPAAKKGGGKKEDKKEAAPPPEATEAAKPEAPAEPASEILRHYVQDRVVAHHQVGSLILGVGNSMNGKQIAVGSVTKAIVAAYRAKLRLFFLKATGPAVRPTAALRVLVLVIPGQPLTHLREMLTFCKIEEKSDRVGVVVVANNGKPKPQKDVLTLGTTESDGTPTYSETVKECTELLAEFGLSDSKEGEDGASTIIQETYPLINVFTLEPTNQNPQPFVDDAVGATQLTKFVAGIKVDFLVLPSSTASEGSPSTEESPLVPTCLAAPKPHLILL